ncbi:exopolysaccharide Pel transporter PelG [Paenibacillus sp. YYML68]|uniref:exopolysaccharide Pel transporter PelG n=1 Tax=Paenibacillus sp. YYML68 TaxID=2909250 RepID=UPI002491ED76|nr:exopolysaccharide Pel transporter PelG [Paenibacillus sp. YYML68]
MAGIGFQLKTLFDKEGIFGRSQAISYAALVTVGPMICCMLAVTLIQLMMIGGDTPFRVKELFQAGTSYAFAFSIMVSSPLSMFLTRCISDQLYSSRFQLLLPTYYGGMLISLIISAAIGIGFVLFASLQPLEELILFILFMEIVMIWIQVVFISAMKEYKKIALAFALGMLLATIGVYLTVYLVQEAATFALLLGWMAAGFFVTAAMLWVEIDKFFQMEEKVPIFAFLANWKRYASLILIGLFTGICMFEHQLAEWYFHGIWIEDSFKLLPEYDSAVYFAVLSVMPTLIWFVVSVETAFYPKFRDYYDAILGIGNILEIDRSRREMEKVLVGELAKLMGLQLAFSIFAVACGIKLLPLIGFTARQILTYNILVMSFYMYIMVTIAILLLLYFDDRIGALCLSFMFFVMNVGASWFLKDMPQFQGLSLFVASLPTLLVLLWRLMYRLRRLHYVTFSAQPLLSKNENKFG